MARYSEDERNSLVSTLSGSIPLVPIEFQLMYLYTLLTLVFAKKDNLDFYTSKENVLNIVPEVYAYTVSKLNKYRNLIAHDGIIATGELFKDLCNCKFELNALAQLCGVTLNWNNSLNLNL